MTPRVSAAVVLDEPGRFSHSTFPVPDIGDDEFLLRVEMVTLCGGDLIEVEGGNRKGRYPLLMGHEVAGMITEIGDRAQVIHGVNNGDRVMIEPYLRCGICPACVRGAYHFCRQGLAYGVTVPCDRPPHLWGGYSQYLYGSPLARVHRLADDLPAAAGCLVTVIGNGVRWIRTRGRARVGEPVLVTGLGVQALATVLVASEAGLGPIVVVARERNVARHELAERFGADLIIDSAASDVGDQVRTALGGGALELAVECTGAEAMIALAVDALDPMGRLVLVGTRGGRSAAFDLDGIVFKELDVLGGLGQANDTELAVEIVNSRRYPVEDMVSHVLPLARAPEAIRLFAQGREDVIHVGLDPWAEADLP